jgi:uncharacterized linocin/CFP29 family protein
MLFEPHAANGDDATTFSIGFVGRPDDHLVEVFEARHYSHVPSSSFAKYSSDQGAESCMTDQEGASVWADSQSSQIRQAIAEELRAARIAGNVLVRVPPSGSDASFVAKLSLVAPSGGPNNSAGLRVDDSTTLSLSTLQVNVFLRQRQVADPELGAALTAFRRAANVLARLEDEIVFRGQPASGTLPAGSTAVGIAEVSGGEKVDGLQDISPAQSSSVKKPAGEDLVSAVSDAVGALESRFQTGPFACVLGANYFQAAQTPNNSLVLPQDRILPFLNGGALVRSSAVDANAGLVLALGGAPIELVISDTSVEFLQKTPDAWSLFRVYEKMVLRVKDPKAVQHLRA